MWQTEMKERPRPILGRVSLLPEESQTDTGARVNFLLPPVLAPVDPRRLSLTSNESALSSASSSSLSEIWAAPGGPTSDLSAWCHHRRRSSGFVSDFGVPPFNCETETFSNNVTFTEEISYIKIGMENVPQWLKQLRLHKYTEYIMSLSYQELLSLNEEKLQKMNVTKGARRKILLSIEKLSERPKTLATINSKLDREGCDIKEILLELETLIKSPVLILEAEKRKGESGEDSGAEVSDDEAETAREQPITGVKLVELIIKTLKKTTSVILLSQYTESKHVSLLVHLIDLCLSQSCYSLSQKQLLQSWRQKIESLWAGPSCPLACPPVLPPKGSQKVKFGFPSAPKSGHLRHDKLAGPWSSPECQTLPAYHNNFFLQRSRSSVPNIHTAPPTSFKKRHSFQEGVMYFQDKFPNLSLGSDRSYPQQSASYSDFTWSSRDSLPTGGLDWPSHTDPLKIFVSCEESADTAEDDELSAGLENLCKAVTDQALD